MNASIDQNCEPSRQDSMDKAAILHAALKNRSAKLGVIGMGYVGLPMAIEFTNAGFNVIGIDVDPDRCEALLAGRSYIDDISNETLQKAVQTGRFTATADAKALSDCDAILICVPTPLSKTKDPDLGAVLSAGRSVSKHLRPGQLIILESTTYPGTTEEVLRPMLEAGGLVVGRDIFLAFSPERVDPGNPNYGVHNITKLVGGVTPACSDLAADLYSQMVSKVVTVSSPAVAEASKLLENTFRSVNIALANEMSIVCRHLGIDVWEVIDAAATKPFSFMAHYPGPGIGGHCIPLDPHYLSWKARLSGYDPKVIQLASEINSAMPHHVVDLISSSLNDESKPVRGSRILILGVAYKPNIADVRESPALEILQMLADRGALLTYSDPYVPSLAIGDLLMKHLEPTAETLRECDCAVIITHHRDFDYEAIVREASLVIDTRNATRPFAHLGKVRYL